MSILMCVGFSVFMFYLLCYKGYTFEPSLLVAMVLLHFIPLYISHRYAGTNYPMENLLMSLLLYGVYMNHIQRSPLDVYIYDTHPLRWKDLFKVCRSEKGDLIPVCTILKLIKYI